MKTVYLHGDLGKRYTRKLEVDAKTIPEIMWALECNLDGFFEHMYKLRSEGTEYIMLSNYKPEKSEETRAEDLITPQSYEINYTSKEIHLVCGIQGGVVVTPLVGAIVGGLGTLGGALSTALGFGGAAGGFTAAGFFKAIAVSVAISFVMQALFKPPEPPKPGEQISTKSYLLSGAQNKTAQGVPVPLGYGRLKIGATVISARKETKRLFRNTTKANCLESYTDIEYLDLLSEGPIEGFVNQSGGVIDHNDIREGIFLNEVPVKNPSTFTSGMEEGSFNFILNEDEELPEFCAGSDNEYKIMSSEVSYVIEYDTLLYGASPYENGEPRGEYSTISSAIQAGAKKFTHAIRNPNVSKVVLTLATQLSQTKDDGATLRNSCRFGILISNKGKAVNILDANSGVISISFLDKEGNKTKIDYTQLRLEMEKKALQSIKDAAELAEWNSEKATYEKVAKIKLQDLQSRNSIINSSFGGVEAHEKLSIELGLMTSQELEIYYKWKNSQYVQAAEADRSGETNIFGKLYGPSAKNANLAFGNAMGKFIAMQENEELESENVGLYVSPTDHPFFMIDGIAPSPYDFDIEIEFDPSENYDSFSGSTIITVVKMSSEYDPAVKNGGGQFDRLNSDSENENRIKSVGGIAKQRLLQLRDVQEKVQVKLEYPHCALCKVKFDSKNFSQLPSRSYHLKLKKVLIPSNYDPISRKYSGPWNGYFKGQSIEGDTVNTISDEYRYWTDNPAWIFYDLVQNPRYGLGKYGLEEYNIDKWQLYKAAKYCDELVETKYPCETSTRYPRSCITDNKISNQAGDGENGTFEISFHVGGWYYSNDTEKEYSSYDADQFRSEFGDGEQYKGSKVAMFIYQHNFSDAYLQNNEPRKFIRKNSCLKKGEYIIEERILKSSNPASKTITVFGPSLANLDSTFNTNGRRRTLFAASLQKNYAAVEPRFTCSTYIHERGQALSVMNNLASVFRGMVGYDFGKILTLQDSKKNPIMLFNNSNVDREKGFSYSGMDKNKKFTAVLVRYNNKNKNFTPDLIYEEDPSAMRIFGYQEKEVMGLGITSETQARRLAKWVLYSSQLENEKISFTVSEEGSYLYPGAVFEVSDENRAGKNMSGRVLDVSSFENGNPYILLDKSADDFISIDKVEFTVNAGRPFLTDEIINGRAASHKSEEDQDTEIEDFSPPQMLKFQASIGINENIKRLGPQGQKTILSNIMAKVYMRVDTGKNLIQSYNHSLQDGNRIRFLSSGKLPAGLNKTNVGPSAYFVVNATLHTFQVSNVNNGDPINIYDEGRDQFGNLGGLHYFAIENNGNGSASELNQKYVDQIEIGSAYSIQGVFGNQVSPDFDIISEELGYIFSVKEIEGKWYYSSLFGDMYVMANNWILSTNLQWINVSAMMYERGSADEMYWFWSKDLGWISTNDNLYNEYWFIESLKSWAYVKYMAKDSTARSQPSFLFIYEQNHGKSKGDAVSIAGTDFIIIYAGTTGYWIPTPTLRDSDAAKNFSSVDPASIEKELTLQDMQNNPSYNSAAINSISDITSDENSVSNQNAIRLQFANGHNLDFFNVEQLEIKDFSSTSNSLNNEMNKKWEIIFISKNEIELINSVTAWTLFQNNTVNDNGFVEYVESIKNLSLRSFQSQLFRVTSIKEVEDRKYEVNGLEYNDSKFDSVDKHLSIKMPALPIPPQADMSLPEPPRDLVLTDLTI